MKDLKFYLVSSVYTKWGLLKKGRRTLMKRPAALRTCPAAVLEEAAKHDEVAEHDEAAEVGAVAEHKECLMLCSRLGVEEHDKATVDEETAAHADATELEEVVAYHEPAEHDKAEGQVVKRPYAVSFSTDLGGGWHKREYTRSCRDNKSGQKYYTFHDACGKQYMTKTVAVAVGCPA